MTFLFAGIIGPIDEYLTCEVYSLEQDLLMLYFELLVVFPQSLKVNHY